MNNGDGANQRPGIFLGRDRSLARSRQCFQHALHNLRLQLWNVFLQSLGHRAFNDLLHPALLRLVVFVVPFRHA